MYKAYLKKSFIFFLYAILLMGIINFTVDPGKIYLNRILANLNAADLSKQLFTSKYGIVQTGWNERLVKTSLAKSTGNFDCIILGSSHIMQISHLRNTGNITQQCKSLLNLGVSGGSIEDISIFSYLIMNNSTHPKKVFISIDPWTLKFNMDARYGAYQQLLNDMNTLLNQEESNTSSYFQKVIMNLINGEYFYHSILSLTEGADKGKIKSSTFTLAQEVIPANIFNLNEGYEKDVTLPDGSHTYNKTWLLKAKDSIKTLPIGGGDYKIQGRPIQQVSVSYLEKIIALFQSKHIEVNFILTPYHPNVFKLGNTKPVQHMRIVEKIILKLSQQTNSTLYGSFFPNKLGCKENEFFDFMHASNLCLNRIDFSL